MSFFLLPGGHIDAERWLDLNPTETGPVSAGYQTTAGLSGQVMTAPAQAIPGFAWPTPNDAWYVVQARMDADGDGECAYYLASSLNGELFVSNDGE
jgi:hypothetical protein